MISAPALARCAPFGLFIAMLALGSVVQAPWVVLARGLVVALALAWFWRSYAELRAVAAPASAWVQALLAGLAACALWIWLDQDWAVLARAPGYDPSAADGSIDWPAAAARFAGFALVVPVMEELFWRSFLLRWIQRRDFLSLAPAHVGAGAFAITTVLFALEHSQWLAGALAGMVYNALYMRAGNLWVPIVAHAVTNGALGIWILATGNWQFW